MGGVSNNRGFVLKIGSQPSANYGLMCWMSTTPTSFNFSGRNNVFIELSQNKDA